MSVKHHFNEYGITGLDVALAIVGGIAVAAALFFGLSA